MNLNPEFIRKIIFSRVYSPKARKAFYVKDKRKSLNFLNRSF